MAARTRWFELGRTTEG